MHNTTTEECTSITVYTRDIVSHCSDVGIAPEDGIVVASNLIHVLGYTLGRFTSQQRVQAIVHRLALNLVYERVIFGMDDVPSDIAASEGEVRG